MAHFPELRELDRLVKVLHRHARVDQAAVVRDGDKDFPLMTFSLGSQDPAAPVLGMFGGVHGVERIGAQVVLAFLTTIAGRLEWDETLHWQLERMRLLFMPIVNPVGMHRSTRSNGNGVDLMRNAPSVAEGATFMVGGQSISARLPWYMGNSQAMELEARTLCDFVRREAFHSSNSILLDCHSGFGLKDQLWFPYAKTREPFPNLPEVFALKSLIDRGHPNHVYRFEPQAKNYVTHGDLWDFLYDEHRRDQFPGVMIPLTLEMGSWIWVRKNPLQLLSFLGAFNPIKPHRLKRALRRHLPLFEVLMRATLAPHSWIRKAEAERNQLRAEAEEKWYRSAESEEVSQEPVIGPKTSTRIRRPGG